MRTYQIEHSGGNNRIERIGGCKIDEPIEAYEHHSKDRCSYRESKLAIDVGEVVGERKAFLLMSVSVASPTRVLATCITSQCPSNTS